MHQLSNFATTIAIASVGLASLALAGAPVVVYLPLLAIVVICLLMMLFMMRGTTSVEGGADRQRNSSDTRTAHRHWR